MRIAQMLAIVLLILSAMKAIGQRFLTDTMDSTTAIGKKNFLLFSNHDRLRFGGYMQPQFQWAESKGSASYAGGDFAPQANNRFTLRRGRIRLDYLHFNDEGLPLAYFAFQFDGTERGVAIRDFWGRFFENKFQLFAITTGMFARPMGYEVNLSSSDRESPERGRMSQILMRTERDLGAMLTIENRRKAAKNKWWKIDIGVFNGQGLTGPMDYDSHKDLIGRIYLKSRKLNKSGWTLSASTSVLYGGIMSQSEQVYNLTSYSNSPIVADSAASNLYKVLPRCYYGADVQLKIPNHKGFTEFRAEIITGKQTATATTSETPGTYPITGSGVLNPLYVRNFNGAYFYYLQHLFRDDLQFVLKYDWYDPNTKISGKQIKAVDGYSNADVKYSTIGGGVVYHVNAHVKATIWYDWIINESTSLSNYLSDVRDDVFTCRVQFRF